MKILVTYAVQGEFVELKFPGMRGNDEVQVGYLRTGIGKVKSAYYLTDALNRLQPDRSAIVWAISLSVVVLSTATCRKYGDWAWIAVSMCPACWKRKVTAFIGRGWTGCAIQATPS